MLVNPIKNTIIITSITLLAIISSVYLELRRQIKPKIKVYFPNGSTQVSYRTKEEIDVAIHIKNTGRFGFPKPAATNMSFFVYAPTSLLLKCVNRGKSKVIDPLTYPDWAYARYNHADIEWSLVKGEDINETGFDEVWIYNVLQHVIDPAEIIANAKRAGKIIRLFEWLEIGVAPGHPHNLLEDQMNEWLGGSGKTGFNGGGKEYYGIFLGDSYKDSE